MSSVFLEKYSYDEKNIHIAKNIHDGYKKNMILKDPKYECFVRKVNDYVNKHYPKRVYEFAKKAGISQGNMSKFLNGKITTEYENQIKIAAAMGTDLEKLMQKDPPPPPQNKIVKFKSEMQRKHFDVIQTFEDAETALHFNEFLSKLEKLDVAKYEEIYGKVRGYVKEIERKELVQSDALKKDKKGA